MLAGEADASSPIALALRGVSKRYRSGDDDQVVLDDVDLEVGDGELVSIVGPSGAGKSTLLYVAAGMTPADSGSVRLGDVELSTAGAEALAEIRRRRIGFVFQFFHLLPSLTVLENVCLPLLLDGRRDPEGPAKEMLERVGLAAKAKRLANELSGGEMQRVAIARALVHQPTVLFADEPTGNLDSVTGALVLDLLVANVRDLGTSMLLVTHDDVAAARADRIITVRDGRVVG